ncbi:putative pheophorbide a oxygenase [Helianthus annuus]|nr:putative pheophorbide a oxygenase [Helianthus annuus]
MFTRDIPYGYEILIENLMDPTHVRYAHYGILDREGGCPMEINIDQMHKYGFTANQSYGRSKFVPPCLHISFGKSARRLSFIFMCIPVSPGNSRLIFIFGRNFVVWIDRFVPRWMYHISQNLVIDSDMYLLHIEEKKLMETGFSNWENVCFVPTKSDAKVIAFRKWLKKYSGGRIDWGNKFDESLPPTPPREQLTDRYRSHVVNCSSCNGAYKGLNAVKVVLQVFSGAAVAMVAATKQGIISVAARNTLAVAAVLCYVGSKWLFHFVHKCFNYHSYNHAFK